MNDAINRQKYYANQHVLRLSLWLSLLLLSLIILIWPVYFHYEYNSIQSVSVIKELPVFAFLFMIWVINLLYLAKKGQFFENALLVCVFSIVFSGFWNIACPYAAGASFDPGGLSFTKYIVENNHIVLGISQWGYFEFPATSILGAVIFEIFGLPILISSKIFLVIASVLLSLSFYIFIRKSQISAFNGLLAVLVSILGNIQFINLDFFRPGTIGFFAMAPFLVVLCLRKTIGSNNIDKMILLLIFSLVTISHFMSSVALLFVLIGIYTYQRLSRRMPLISTNLIVAAMTIEVFWWIFVSVFATGFVINSYANFFSKFEVTLDFALQKGNALLAGNVPLWASSIRLFWMILIFILPCIFFFVSHSRKMKKNSILLQKEKGALFGLLALLLLMTIADMGGNRSVSQFMLFSVFFTVPILMIFLLQFERIFPKFTSWILVIIVFSLAFPTFLVNSPSVNTQISYGNENSAFVYLHEYNLKDNSEVFSDLSTGMLSSYYLPNTKFNPVPFPPDYAKTKAEFNIALPSYMQSYVQGQNGYFIYSPRITHFSEIMLNVPANDPVWNNVINILSVQNIIYDNDFNWISTNKNT